MTKHRFRKQNMKAIILANSRDFGRCPLASHLPAALWPVAGKAVLENLVVHLANQGIKQAVICSNGDGALLAESIQADNRLELKVLNESLPVGTAGCIRDAVGDETEASGSGPVGPLLVFPATITCPPKIDVLINAHIEGKSDLTVLLNRGCGNGKSPGEPAEIYVCETSVLEHIPKEGYFDIKEGLIPEMLHAGKTIHAATLPNDVGNFRNRQEYLYAIAKYLESAAKPGADLKLRKGDDSQNVWIAVSAKIDPTARIYGPAVIMDGANISEGAVILGPTILGKNVSIGKDSVTVNSVLWDGAQIGPNCEVQRCVIDYGAIVKRNMAVQDRCILFKKEGVLMGSAKDVLKVAKSSASRLQDALQQQFEKINEKMPDWIQTRKAKIVPWLGGGVVLIVFLWCYWPGLMHLWNFWRRSDEYSSGLLVPFLAVYILWSRRDIIAQCRIKPCIWGLFAFIAAQAFRLFGLFFLYSSAERLSIVLSVAALAMLLFGWRLLRKVSTTLLFLCLMLPWPNRIQEAVTLPLQRWATSSAVFCLEVIGYEVAQEGNVIHIGDSSVAVAEACNGLRMVTAFFVISGLVVLLVRRAWWEKLIVLASSIPVALLCNTMRLAITALFFTVLEGEGWEKIFHDFGGYAMMPLALAAVVAELWLLAKLTMLPTKEEALIITRQNR